MVSNTRRGMAPWTQPEVKKLDAGSAEANGTTKNDGGPVGNARS